LYCDIYKTRTSYPQRYWWVGNGETLSSSEMLSTKAPRVNAINVMKHGTAEATSYDETGEARAA
jgi:uncharacterized protein YegP (UPF0339 family)